MSVFGRLALAEAERYTASCREEAAGALSGGRASVLYMPSVFASQKYRRRRCGYSSQFLTAYVRAHRNIRRIVARLSPVNAMGQDDGCYYRPRGMTQRTFERLWLELDRNEKILNDRACAGPGSPHDRQIANRFRFVWPQSGLIGAGDAA